MRFLQLPWNAKISQTQRFQFDLLRRAEEYIKFVQDEIASGKRDGYFLMLHNALQQEAALKESLEIAG